MMDRRDLLCNEGKHGARVVRRFPFLCCTSTHTFRQPFSDLHLSSLQAFLPYGSVYPTFLKGRTEAGEADNSDYRDESKTVRFRPSPFKPSRYPTYGLALKPIRGLFGF